MNQFISNPDLLNLFNDMIQKFSNVSEYQSQGSTSEKQNQKYESGFAGFKPGFLNSPTKFNSNSNTNVARNSQQSSGTQNKNTKTTNKNNLYDIPADGSCLFWSVAPSYLVPVRNNNEEFRNRFIQLS